MHLRPVRSGGDWASPEGRRGIGPSLSGKYHNMGYDQRGFLSARSSVLTIFVDVRTMALRPFDPVSDWPVGPTVAAWSRSRRRH